MKAILTLSFVFSAIVVVAQWNYDNQNLIYSQTGKVGVGVSTPQTTLHLNSAGSTFLRLEKPASSNEVGIQFNVGSTTKFYFWSDNGDNDALKLSGAGISGENDGTPRMMFPSDNANIYMAQSGGKIGVGTNSPSAKFHIVGQGESWTTSAWNKAIEIPNVSVLKWAANSNGWRFGIGQTDGGLYFVRNNGDGTVTAPNYDLFVSNNGRVAIGHDSPYSYSRLHIKESVADGPFAFISEAKNNDRIIGMSHDGTNGMISTSYLGTGGYSPLLFRTSNITRLTVAADGNVGIGTTSPNQKLTVNGTIYGKEVKVDLSVPGPDYVFEKEYDLPSLEEIKAYVDEHKHLPEVPSASEMEANGINLGEMNILLLKKVEELTLHLIEQNKELKELRSEVNRLKAKK